MSVRYSFLDPLFLLIFSFAIFASVGLAHAQYPGFGDPVATNGNGNGTGLVPVEPNVSGGTIPIGATGQVVILFRNEGSKPVETGLIRLYPSSTVSGAVSMNQCEEEPLPYGAECAIALSVKALQSGPWRIEMLMTHSGKSRLVTATLTGTVEATEGSDSLTSDIEAIPNELDFGSLQDSQTLIEPIILRNITSNAVEIKDIYIDTSAQAGYTLKTECTRLEAGQACIAIVTWSPKLSGRSSGVLIVEHSGPTALASIPLKGQYSPANVSEAEVFPQAVPGKGLLVSSQVDIDFGTGVETASTMTVSLVNAGDSNLTIDDIKISGSDNGLSFKEDGCVPGMSLEPIEACPLTVTWSPTRVGSVLDDIQISHDGARGVLVLPVRGESASTVSQDQKAIVLSSSSNIVTTTTPGISEGDGTMSAPAARRTPSATSYGSSLRNPAILLDGYKITSFSPTRAIINGPGGSRIVFDDEEIVLGGVPWYVAIQPNGIEFSYQEQRVLLLFDRSLSSINRVSSSSGSGDDSSG